ncbi:MAG TPA: hypothetical protein VLU95_00445 [Candidatus Acidoferrum sp.]|nr:hypothetical protein [Candidatus Acidoferrum sp.]
MSNNKLRESYKLRKRDKENRKSSEEFLKGYNAIWKEGPSVKYQNPDAWSSHISQSKSSS